MKIGMHIILCQLAAWLQMHPYLKGNLRETWARVLFLAIVACPPHLLKKGLHVL